jgi:hypothetical protein
MDSGGVRVQIMRVVKIGPQDGDPSVDFGAEIENLFRAMAGIHESALGLADNSDPKDTPETVDNAKPFSLQNDTDRYWMNLLETDSSSNKNGVEQHVETNRDGRSETTTTVVKATHKVKLSDRSAKSTPPRSIFARLAPSRDRYTLLRDEL